jgi:hypothetical protein
MNPQNESNSYSIFFLIFIYFLFWFLSVMAQQVNLLRFNKIRILQLMSQGVLLGMPSDLRLTLSGCRRYWENSIKEITCTAV